MKKRINEQKIHVSHPLAVTLKMACSFLTFSQVLHSSEVITPMPKQQLRSGASLWKYFLSCLGPHLQQHLGRKSSLRQQDPRGISGSEQCLGAPRKNQGNLYFNFPITYRKYRFWQTDYLWILWPSPWSFVTKVCKKVSSSLNQNPVK